MMYRLLIATACGALLQSCGKLDHIGQAPSLSPQTQLPGLREGQTWTVEVCNLLSYPNKPVEILHAGVVGLERLFWQGKMVHAWLVEYHNNPGSELSPTVEPRGRLWVQLDGTVLMQEVSILNSRMKFVRMDQKQAEVVAEKDGRGL